MAEPQFPYWWRQLNPNDVSFTLTGEQAAAIARELRDLAEEGPLPPRLDELRHRLSFDADYFQRRHQRRKR